MNYRIIASLAVSALFIFDAMAEPMAVDASTSTVVPVTTSPASAETSAPAGATPKIAFDEVSKDLGDVEEGTKIQFKFEVSNKGTAPLSIPRVQPSCGCTNVKIDKNELAPGESTTIHGEFDTNGRPGAQHKTITVESNDPNGARTMLSFKTNVVSEMNITPNYLDFGEVILDTGSSRTVTVTGRMTPPLAITAVDVLNTSVVSAAVTDNRTLPSDAGSTATKTESIITLTVSPKAPIGRFTGILTITSTSTKRPKFNVPFSGTVVGDMRAEPSSIFLRNFDETLVTTNTFRLSSRSNTPFEVKDVHASVNSATWKPGPESPDGKKQIVFELKLTEDRPRSSTDTLVLKTTNPKQDTLEVPLTIFRSSAPRPPAAANSRVSTWQTSGTQITPGMTPVGASKP